MTIPGGHSVVAYLQKVHDGVIFSETFENDNFLTAEGWTTLQGTPANTSNQYKQGIKSFDNSANSQSLPVIKKTFNSGVDGTFSTRVWFYDDPTDVTSQGPYFKVKLSDGKFIQVGVRNGTSTTKYSCNAAATFTEDNFAATSIDRVAGWMYFVIQASFFGSTQTVKIFIFNGGAGLNEAFSADITGLSHISEIYVQSNTVGGTGNSFGYFDSLALFSKGTVTINAQDVTALKVYNSSNVLVQSFASLSTSQTIFPWAVSPNLSTVFPFPCYLEFSKSNSIHNLLFRSALTQINPGDIYELSNIDFGRKFTSMDIVPATLSDRAQTKQGVQAVETYGLKNRNSFNIDQLDADNAPWKKNAENFFYYAREGGPFGVNVDNENELAFGVISKFIPDTNTNISIMDNLSTLATDNFSAGQKLIIQTKDNTHKQDVTVASVDTNSRITISDRLRFDVNAGDYIYSQYFFPWQELVPDNLAGFRQVDAQNIRYSWGLPTADFNGDT